MPYTFAHTTRKGVYYCLVDPALDGLLAPSLGALKLYNSEGLARASLVQQFQGEAINIEDLREDLGPSLAAVRVPEDDYVDLVTARGCRSAGLPTSFPLITGGGAVGEAEYQALLETASQQHEQGVVHSTAFQPLPPEGVGEVGEELVYLQQKKEPLIATESKSFDSWFYHLSA